MKISRFTVTLGGGLSLAFLAAAVLPVGDVISAETQIIPIPAESTSPVESRSATQIAQSRGGLKVEGASVRRLSGKNMGLPRSALPGARFLSYGKWLKMTQIPKTGLFIVDSFFVPRELPGELKRAGYRLKRNGTLVDRKGQPIALFVKSAYFELMPKGGTKPKRPLKLRTPTTPGGQLKPGTRGGLAPDGDDGATGKHAAHGGVDLGGLLAGLLVSEAQAGNPYAFRCFSAGQWAVYRGGYCRNYETKTTVHAYGFDRRNRCGRSSPHTRIQSIETRASIGRLRDRDSCRNCDRESSRIKWNIGCFWPAHRRASGRNFMDMLDGRTHVTRSWSWRH